MTITAPHRRYTADNLYESAGELETVQTEVNELQRYHKPQTDLLTIQDKNYLVTVDYAQERK